MENFEKNKKNMFATKKLKEKKVTHKIKYFSFLNSKKISFEVDLTPLDNSPTKQGWDIDDLQI